MNPLIQDTGIIKMIPYYILLKFNILQQPLFHILFLFLFI